VAWTYSDYESQSTDAARLSRLRLHKQEITDQIAKDYAVAGRSVQTAHLVSYISTIVDPRLRELESRVGTESGANKSGTFVRVRPI
jgi:hypothetical protein